MANDFTSDPFEGCAPVRGLEHLGRAILDKQGQPSGSPANYEATRGQVDPTVASTGGEITASGEPPQLAVDTEAIIEQINAEFSGQPGV